MSPGQTYRGRLAVDGDSKDLVVDLRIEAATVEVQTSRESLGVWPIAHVSVARLEDGRFALQLGDEKAYFRAEDPLAFSFEAVPTIQEQQGRARKGLRAYLAAAAGNGGSSLPTPETDIPVETPRGAVDAGRSKASDPSRSPAPTGRHLRGVELGA